MSTATIESPWVDFSIHGTSEEQGKVRDKIFHLMREAGWIEEGADSHHFSAILLILEELIVNARKHGNGMNSELPIHIRHRITEEEVVFSIQDSGPGFNPSEVPDPTTDENLERPSGRGLLLARKFATSIEFIHGTSDQTKTNHIRVTRRRDHPPIIPLDD